MSKRPPLPPPDGQGLAVRRREGEGRRKGNAIRWDLPIVAPPGRARRRRSEAESGQDETALGLRRTAPPQWLTCMGLPVARFPSGQARRPSSAPTGQRIPAQGCAVRSCPGVTAASTLRPQRGLRPAGADRTDGRRIPPAFAAGPAEVPAPNSAHEVAAWSAEFPRPGRCTSPISKKGPPGRPGGPCRSWRRESRAGRAVRRSRSRAWRSSS